MDKPYFTKLYTKNMIFAYPIYYSKCKVKNKAFFYKISVKLITNPAENICRETNLIIALFKSGNYAVNYR